MAKQKWVHHSVHNASTINYMKARKSGRTTSLILPYKAINKSSINGWERNTITTIAGRPSQGKTLMLDEIARKVRKLNPKLNLSILKFNFEMVGRMTKLRELTSVTGVSYRDLCSADSPLDDSILKRSEEYFKETADEPINVADEPDTVAGIEKTIHEYMKAHSHLNKLGKVVYQNVVIFLDHSLLVKCSEEDKGDKKNMLMRLGEMFTKIKKMYPIWIIILSQLNRNIEKPERNKNGSVLNYPNSDDIYGSDALMQHSDNIYIITVPYKRSIEYYGLDEIIVDDSLVVVHTIKQRSGNLDTFYLKAHYANMSFADYDQAPEKRVKRNKQSQTQLTLADIEGNHGAK